MSLSKTQSFSSTSCISLTSLVLGELAKFVEINKQFCKEVPHEVIHVIKMLSLALGIIIGAQCAGLTGATSGALIGVSMSTKLCEVQKVQKIAECVWGILPELLRMVLVKKSEAPLYGCKYINDVGEKIQNSPQFQKMCTLLETIHPDQLKIKSKY